MEFVKAMLVCFILMGCAEVASELPLLRGATPAAAPPAPLVSEGSRLGPPSPRGLGLRRVDRQAAARTTGAL